MTSASCSYFKIKGLDRALLAIASLPESLRSRTRLCVIGRDKPAPWRRLARKLALDGCVQFLGLRSDLPPLLWGADLLLHPAYIECGGTVLVEALAAGLPVLTTEVCGYAPYVEQAGAGIVVRAPFTQAALDESLLRMLHAEDLGLLGKKALDYSRIADIFSLPERAADAIEQVALRKTRHNIATCR
jgi:UDP-glucose:(heptosyl)LPS alpha-1,3-glucosyltransferase